MSLAGAVNLFHPQSLVNVAHVDPVDGTVYKSDGMGVLNNVLDAHVGAAVSAGWLTHPPAITPVSTYSDANSANQQVL